MACSGSWRRRRNDIRHAQAALQELQKDPKNGAKKFDSDPELKRFLTEFCEVMGAHFETLGAADAPPAPPTAAEKKAMGPLASAVVEDAARGAGPAPASTPKEKAEVDAVLNDAALCDILMDPKTQELMQRCADPREFEPASGKPRENPGGFDFVEARISVRVGPDSRSFLGTS